MKYEHAIDFMTKKYLLTPKENEAFPEWYAKHHAMLETSCNDAFKKWINTYIDSYLVGKAEQSFVMLFVILEMLFGAEGNEISYRIRRGTAFLLSNSREEMIKISNQVKTLYNSRSKYVHSGRAIEWNDLLSLREIVRSVIVLMYDKGFHKPDFNHKRFLEDITLGGYRND